MQDISNLSSHMADVVITGFGSRVIEELRSGGGLVESFLVAKVAVV
jgi:hypothetical protein